MIKCKNTILNELMDNAAELIKGKIQYTTIVLEQFEEKGDKLRVQSLQSEIEEMTLAMKVITKRSGSWA